PRPGGHGNRREQRRVDERRRERAARRQGPTADHAAAAREDREAAEEAFGAGIGAESDRVRGDGVAYPHLVAEHERAADRSHGAGSHPYSRAQRRPRLAEDRVLAEQRLAERPVGCGGHGREAENGEGQDATTRHPLHSRAPAWSSCDSAASRATTGNGGGGPSPRSTRARTGNERTRRPGSVNSRSGGSSMLKMRMSARKMTGSTRLAGSKPWSKNQPNACSATWASHASGSVTFRDGTSPSVRRSPATAASQNGRSWR